MRQSLLLRNIFCETITDTNPPWAGAGYLFWEDRVMTVADKAVLITTEHATTLLSSPIEDIKLSSRNFAQDHRIHRCRKLKDTINPTVFQIKFFEPKLSTLESAGKCFASNVWLPHHWSGHLDFVRSVTVLWTQEQ